MKRNARAAGSPPSNAVNIHRILPSQRNNAVVPLNPQQSKKQKQQQAKNQHTGNSSPDKAVTHVAQHASTLSERQIRIRQQLLLAIALGSRSGVMRAAVASERRKIQEKFEANLGPKLKESLECLKRSKFEGLVHNWRKRRRRRAAEMMTAFAVDYLGQLQRPYLHTVRIAVRRTKTLALILQDRVRAFLQVQRARAHLLTLKWNNVKRRSAEHLRRYARNLTNQVRIEVETGWVKHHRQEWANTQRLVNELLKKDPLRRPARSEAATDQISIEIPNARRDEIIRALIMEKRAAHAREERAVKRQRENGTFKLKGGQGLYTIQDARKLIRAPSEMIAPTQGTGRMKRRSSVQALKGVQLTGLSRQLSTKSMADMLNSAKPKHNGFLLLSTTSYDEILSLIEQCMREEFMNSMYTQSSPPPTPPARMEIPLPKPPFLPPTRYVSHHAHIPGTNFRLTGVPAILSKPPPPLKYST